MATSRSCYLRRDRLRTQPVALCQCNQVPTTCCLSNLSERVHGRYTFKTDYPSSRPVWAFLFLLLNSLQIWRTCLDVFISSCGRTSAYGCTTRTPSRALDTYLSPSPRRRTIPAPPSQHHLVLRTAAGVPARSMPKARKREPDVPEAYIVDGAELNGQCVRRVHAHRIC